MEVILEILWIIFVEILGTSFFEAIVEFIIRAIVRLFGLEKNPHPFFAFIGYNVAAFLLGSISIGLFKSHIIHSEALQIANLILVPIVVGLLMKLRGDYLEKNKKKRIHLNSFVFGYAFALTFLLVRFFFVKH